MFCKSLRWAWGHKSSHLMFTWASLMAQTVKNLPAMHETWV